MVGFTNLSRILISMRKPCIYRHAGDALGLPQNPYVESYLNYIVQLSMLWELWLCATLLCQTSICIPAWRTTIEDQSLSGICFWWLWFPAWFGSDVVGGGIIHTIMSLKFWKIQSHHQGTPVVSYSYCYRKHGVWKRSLYSQIEILFLCTSSFRFMFRLSFYIGSPLF